MASLFYPSHTSAYPDASVFVQVLSDTVDDLRLVPMSQLATRYCWDKKTYTTKHWITFMAKNPETPQEAQELSDQSCLWFVLPGEKFMTPCVITGNLPDVSEVEPIPIISLNDSTPIPDVDEPEKDKPIVPEASIEQEELFTFKMPF